MEKTLYRFSSPEDRVLIIPEDVFSALQQKAEEEAARIAGPNITPEDHPVARLITAKSLAQKVLRTFAEKQCTKYYKPSRSRRMRGEGE